MIRVLTIIFLTLFITTAHADDLEDADKVWANGKPWPAHWGLIKYPYNEGWNVIALAYVNKIYGTGEAADTKIKDIPYARQADASVEVCMMKRGMLKLAGFCAPAVVDPDILGTLKPGDVIAYLYGNHGTKRFSFGPGSDARTTLRVFQKISEATDESCWQREALFYIRPIAESCFNKIDRTRVEQVLTRDFGPRNGSNAVLVENAYAVGKKVEVVKPDFAPSVSNPPANEQTERTGPAIDIEGNASSVVSPPEVK